MKKRLAILIGLCVMSSGCMAEVSRNDSTLMQNTDSKICAPAGEKKDVCAEPEKSIINGEEFSCWGCLKEEPYVNYPQWCCIQVTARTCANAPHVWCTSSQSPSWAEGKCWE